MATTTLTEMEIQRRHRLGIGGSEVAALYGVSPWVTEVGLWLERTGRAAHDVDPNNIAIRIGNELEQLVADLTAEALGVTLLRYDTMLQQGHAIGNVDRIVQSDDGVIHEIVECKTTTQTWDDVPIYYQLQCQHYMALLSHCERCYLGALNTATRSYTYYIIERDEAVASDIIQRVNAWWERYVVADVQPPARTEEDARRLYPTAERANVEADGEIIATLERLRSLNVQAGAIADQIGECKALVMSYIGDRGTDLVAGRKTLATWRCQAGRASTDWRKLCADNGIGDDVIEHYTTHAHPTRVLRIK